MNGKKDYLLAIIVFSLLCLVGFTQYQTDQTLLKTYRKAQIKQIPPVYLPSAEAISRTNAGFNTASADLVWLNLIQYFGGGNPNQPYASLNQMLNTVIELDPQFEYPYLFGGIILPWQEEPQAALDILNKGLNHFPQNGLMYYYAGSIAKLYLNEPKLAAQYFQQSIGKKDTPKAAAVLAGISLTELDDREFALKWWEGILTDETQNEVIKERAQVWQQHLQIVLELEKQIKLAEQSGHSIKALEDLIDLGLIKEIPLSPLGFEYIYQPTTGRVELDK